MSLSGGQKQRLSIARAVLKPAEILIFDDATSALDLKTESNLYKALQKTKPESTKIIIAQRIASVRGADRIAVLENGKIAACGSHEELMKISPRPIRISIILRSERKVLNHMSDQSDLKLAERNIPGMNRNARFAEVQRADVPAVP